MTTQRSGTNQPTVADVRRRLLRQHRLAVIERFDTYGHTSGTKDVMLAALPDGRRAILRIGEARPARFFPAGYQGKYLVIPQVYARRSRGVPWELEEYLPGRLLSEVDRLNVRTGAIAPPLLRRLVGAFWEFQRVGQTIPLKPQFNIEKIFEHLRKAKPLLREPKLVERIILRYRAFWFGRHPSKWKYALDNLMLTPNGKIGFIDNAGVGLRYLGYDLGWLLWPGWITMATSRYANVRAYLAYLNRFEQLARQLAPPRVPVRNGVNRNFLWLTVLERLVGAAFDVANHTRHLAHHGLGPDGPPKRRHWHVTFLNTLLKHVISQLES